MPNSSDFNHFSYSPVDIGISRSLFNMDHSVKFSCNLGECIPFEVINCLPGDTWSIDTTKVIRTQPLVAPIMGEIIGDVYYFFVPYRLVWSHWKEFMGENNSSAWKPTVEYNIPKIYAPQTGGFDVGTIADYMGIPPKKPSSTPVGNLDGYNALPFRAYALIMDQWFRSEAVMDPVNVFVDDSNRMGSNGDDQVADIQLGGKPFVACKFFDYFTSCLPSPQRGDAVTIPLVDQTSSNVYFPVVSVDPDGTVGQSHPQRVGMSVQPKSGVQSGWNTKGDMQSGVAEILTANTDRMLNYHLVGPSSVSGDFDWPHVSAGDTATLTSALANRSVFFTNLFTRFRPQDFNPLLNSVSINDLRTAFAIQRFYEKSARYGGRYIEYIKAFFDVDSPDARLQRAEYLGGSRISLNINSVEQTSSNESQPSPLGTVAGMSVTADSNSDFTYSCTEHGCIIGIAVFRHHPLYQQGVERFWLAHDMFDFYNPVFANLGEMPVYTDEIYLGSNTGTSRRVFGYQEAWADYRYKPSRVAGEMRSVYSQSLDMWHLADYYDSYPTLSPAWLREDKSVLDRCLAVTSDVSNQIICDFFIETKASRPLPLYSIPGLVDHN